MKLKRMAVDLAWKTEGLPQYLEKKGEPYQASIIEWAQTIALWDPMMAGIENIPSEKPSIEKLSNAFKNMALISRYHNYDSGKRKFNYHPIKGIKKIITKEDLIEIMLKAEGLSGILREKGHSAEEVEFTEAMLTNHRLFTGIIDSTKEQKAIEWAYKTLYTLTKHYNYDSGKRKFNSILNNII